MTGNQNGSDLRRIDSSTEEKEYQVIGTRPIRHDGVDKVTGRALYGNDIRLPGMLYGAVLRSPHAHARIIRIDTRQAEALFGVSAVITSADLPTARLPEERHFRNLRANTLAFDKALYHGHAIAAVAASSPHIAQAALALIQVEYELLPPVLDVRQAMLPGAPILLEDLRTNEFGVHGNHPTNIVSHEQTMYGDIEKGFRQATFIVEHEFITSMVHQGYIEPQNATALWNMGGQITIWCSTQGAFGVRDSVADILGLPVSRIRVIPMEIGGGFGGKNEVYLEPLATLLSRKSGNRPVKMIMGYDEVLCATGPTSGSYMRVKIGADSEGRITAAEAYMVYEVGGFPTSSVGSGMNVIFAPYRVPNSRIDGYDVLVNKPRIAAYRAPGGTNANFAAEVVIDELSEKLGMDPLDFRLLNGVRTGDRRADGPVYPKIGFMDTLQAAKNHPHYSDPLVIASETKQSQSQSNKIAEITDQIATITDQIVLPSGERLLCRSTPRNDNVGTIRFGRGVASGYWGNYGGKSSASASVNADGTISLVEGSVDLGGSRVVIAMQLAETLGLRTEDIRPLVADTDSVGYTEGTYGSRTTFATGWAVYELGQSIKNQMIERAARYWEVESDQVCFEMGVFTSGNNRLTFKELAERLDETGGGVVASAAVRPESEGPAFATHIVDVSIDIETGKVQVLRYTAVQDVGKAIHPGFVEGQIQGGVAQGIGWGLNEEYFYDEQGHLLNASLLDYRIPTCLDLPMIEAVIVEVPNPGHPYGVRGVGEMPIVPPPAALANAIYRAIGVRLTNLPMSPHCILEALWNKEKV
jgi:xanthine dehydrogenase molybdenum-binding subunit